MADETPPVGSGAPNDDRQPGAPATPPASGVTQPVPGATEPVSNPEAKRYADEAAAERKARKALEAELKKFQDAQLTDAQKLEQRATEAEKARDSYKARIASYAVQLEAQRLGIIDPEVAAALIAGRLEFADDGSPKNADTLLKELVAAKPYLLAAQQPAGQPPVSSSGSPANPARGAGTLLVSREQYNSYAFRKAFETQHKMDLDTGIRQGIAALAE